MSKKEDIRKQLTSSYETLSPFEQTLLQLCSVIYEPTIKTDIFKCMSELSSLHSEQKLRKVADLTPFLEKLQDLNFLDKNYTCNSSFVEIATRKVIQSGTYWDMVNVVRSEMIKGKPYLAKHSKSASRIMRDFRIGIYTHNTKLVDESYGQLMSYYGDSYETKDPYIEVCNNPFDGQWFSTLPIDIQRTCLIYIITQYVYNLENCTDALEYALSEDFLKTIPLERRPAFNHTLVFHLILSGKLEEAQERISDIEEIKAGYTGGLRGWLYFIEGKNYESIMSYEADLKELREMHRKKTEFFAGECGVFYILALLKTQDFSQLKKIDQVIGAALKNKYLMSTLQSVYYSLRAIVWTQMGESEHARELLEKRKAEANSLSIVFYAFADFWLNGELSKENIRSISRLFSQAKELDLKWLAMVCAELLQRCGDNGATYMDYCKKVQKDTAMVSLVGMIQLEDPWQKSLKALIDTTAPESKKLIDKSGASRLIWLFKYNKNYITLKAKEQICSAKGIWSKGRPLALSRLFSGKNLDFATRQDHLIRATLIKEAHYYTGPVYYFDWDKTLPLLVGHPLIVLEDSPHIPVEIVKGEPEIEVKKSPSGITIKFSTSIKDKKVILEQETPTRYKVIIVSDKHLKISRILGDRGLNVPVIAQEQVLKAIAGISSFVTVHSAISETSVDIKKVEADSIPHMHLLPSGSGFRVQMFVKPFAKGGPFLKPGKGTENVIAEIDGVRLQTQRDMKLEEKRAAKVEDRCPALADFLQEDGQWYVEEAIDCLEVLYELKALEEKDEVIVQWPEGEKLKLTQEVSFDHLHLKIGSQKDWFDVSGQLKLDDTLSLELDKLLELIENSDNRFLHLGDGRFVALTREFRKRIQELNAYTQVHGKDYRLHPLSAFALEDFIDNLTHLDADNVWKKRLKQIKEGHDLTPEVSSTFKCELRDYQIKGYQWLSRLAYWGVGGCLADDMGLGKTIQALAIIVDRAPEGPTLVVAPTSVCMNWLLESNRFAPTLNVTIFGSGNREEIVKNQKKFDLLVVSYGLLQQEAELLSSVNWHTIVLDEAQAIKNITTQRAQAAMNLKGSFKLITTGTPIENHLGELYTLFNFINPGIFSTRKSFNERFAIAIEKDQNRGAKQQLKKLIQPFILRRIKSQVLDELPPRTDIVLYAEMGIEERAFYEALRLEAVKRLAEEKAGGAGQRHIQVLAEITKLRRACCNSRLIMEDLDLPVAKLDLFSEVLSEILENNHKALVFSQFVGHLTIIREFLDEKKIDYRYLDGSTPAKERQKEVDAFQSGQGDLFLISLRAGGLGLNLTAADYVIHMDPWWNPAVEDQASDRAHRIGQQHPVTVYRLVTKNTIEEKILALHHEKRELASSLLDGSDISGKISADELLKMIREK